MAQPSQVFPPWLTPSLVQITDAAGAVATETTVVYIPPTYFGPSIPLGSLYIFGGTTEPATIVLPGASTSAVSSPITTAIPISTSLTTIATPTTSVPTSTPSSTSATSTSISSSSVSLTSSLSEPTSIQTSFSFSTGSIQSQTTSPSSTATSTGAIGHASGLTRGQLVGVIVASILGLIFFFVLALFLFLCIKGRRNRRQFATLTPIDEDYFIVPPGGRLPGEGSPRHSGEEADPFLQQSSGSGRARGGQAAVIGAAAGVGAAAMTQVPSQAASRNGGSRVPPPVATNGSNSSGSTNSNASGFGVLLDRPSLGYLPVMPEHEHEALGTPLSPVDMERIGREHVLPDESAQYPDEEYTGAYAYSMDSQAPPRLVEPTTDTPLLGGPVRPPFVSQPSRLSDKSSFEHENATLMVARRVKAEDLGPRSLSQQSESTAGPSNRPNSGLLAALGLSGLANLGRMSWFKNLDSPRHSGSTRTHRSAERLSEKDVESGKSLLSPDIRPADSFGQRTRATNVGTGPDGLRPASGVSARSGTSGGTIYHDAASSIPGTPAIASLPRALTPPDAVPVSSEHAWISSPLLNQPPAYSNPLTSPAPSSPTPPPPADILDMPAPTALNHFSSLSSIKETPTGSSFSSKPPPFFPPGLDTIRPVGWSMDSSTITEMTASRGSFGPSYGLGMIGMDHADAIAIDILEEAPPNAEHGWRNLAASGGLVGAGRRTTFGLFSPGSGVASEQGSLHSMASDFTRSMRSTGSAAASRRDMQGSIGSNSSRPSAHSVAQSMGSGLSVAHSLVRQGSITSDDRRRGTNSPALSAFGYQSRQATQSGLAREVRIHDQASSPGLPAEAAVPTIGSPPSAHTTPDKTNTIRSVGSGSTTVMGLDGNTTFSTLRAGSPPTERSISPLSMTFSMDAPWAGGLDSNWQPTAAP